MTDQAEPAGYPGLLLYRARVAARVSLRGAARAAGCSHTLLSLIETGRRRIWRTGGNFDLEALFRLYRMGGEDRRVLEAAVVAEETGGPFGRRGVGRQ